ncbi:MULTISPECIES: CGNR zinc finger domain-containing protein [unclassified Amycolatopsis]|uniref:CGNR zinc finger domain-containing protein n=1 Tax=unclassified Amycolatopsis TaxID=2618356 RepID=UPI002874423A|nr:MULTISPECIES: CGNR zinc finger domain-containing protein [unclassified Amycolatopsis]MDS0136037.1 CGNR zinc finger domain-containing protein [Amycolatopsis sp. 505]MDS0145374.1 CGNR zinc finger domain-containing protein [Amycolatopsis sp. CM201R]
MGLEVRLTKTDEALLLDLLNTTPVRDGRAGDDLAGPRAGRAWLAGHGQPATDDELRALLEVRPVLQAVVRGDASPTAAARFVDGASYRAAFGDDGVEWVLDVPPGRSAAARAVLAWDALAKSSPGRLRPCANPECRLFLIDHSKPNSARWCSMAVCGNRMKARRHYQRTRISAD